ncbi:hypothetical protein P5673_033698 [Acropora cervicornis]|uniref:Uncharacterized protein n=1 Tax=Acropora cervicornis TaxID=6130 RepID=A0AAD9UQY3_ACRCE|nr:hypothetical protein P5673_033698 [Acropora cervicornis]
MAKIVQGLLREKLADEALTATQNRYNTPENCECLTSTKVNHLIWDKLKSGTRSADIKLQRVQSNLVKGLVLTVSVIEKLVKARDNIPKDALDVPELSVPFTKFLFGNDADSSKQMKDLAEETKEFIDGVPPVQEADYKLVSQIAETTGGSSIDDHSQGNPSDSSRVPESSPIEAKACPLCRDSTRSEAFLREQSILFSIPGANHHRNNPICPTISVAVDFLTSLYDGRLSYSSINSVRCALSTILESPASGYSYSTFGEHPDVKRLVKGIFQSRATLPLHCKTWDVNLVLHLVHWLTMGNPEFSISQ